jgi:excisionase family DNA binding protein
MSQPAVHFTTAQAAKLIGIHTRTLYEWLLTGRLPEPRRMPRGKVPARLFTHRDIERAQELKRANDIFRGCR